MELKRIAPLSAMRVFFGIYGGMGLFFGAILSLVAIIGSGFLGMGGVEGPDRFFGLLFGAGAVVILPIFYGTIGALGGLLVSFLYNLAAGWLGGLELELE